MKNLIVNFFTSTYSVKLVITILIILFIIKQFTRNQEKLMARDNRKKYFDYNWDRVEDKCCLNKVQDTVGHKEILNKEIFN